MKISEAQYKYAQRRVEELLEVVTDTTLPTSTESIELSIMSTFVEEYEKRYHPIEKLTLAEVIKQGLKAKGMTQKDLSEAVGLSTSRISDFTQGKSEPRTIMAFEIEVDREHIENTLSVTYTMGQINSYMEIIRELKEIPEDNVVDIRKTIWRLQDRIQMLLALNPEAKLELETERSEGLKV